MSRFITTQIFRDRAAAALPQYDFSQSVYVYAKERVAFFCPEHGEVDQYPFNIYNGIGCAACGNARGGPDKSHADFMADARSVHGNTYTYARTKYTHSKAKVTITCRKHGDFEQLPNVHVRAAKSGCPKCGDDRGADARMKPFDQFVTEARECHGDQYEYDRASYRGALTPTRIKCPEHGVFMQPPDSHVNNYCGCPGCTAFGFNAARPAWLYYLRIAATPCDVYKIGITTKPIDKRYTPAEMKLITVLQTKRFKLGKWAKAAESQTLRTFTDDRYTGPDLLRAGNTEIFTRDVLNLDKEQQ